MHTLMNILLAIKYMAIFVLGTFAIVLIVIYLLIIISIIMALFEDVYYKKPHIAKLKNGKYIVRRREMGRWLAISKMRVIDSEMGRWLAMSKKTVINPDRQSPVIDPDWYLIDNNHVIMFDNYQAALGFLINYYVNYSNNNTETSNNNDTNDNDIGRKVNHG